MSIASKSAGSSLAKTLSQMNPCTMFTFKLSGVTGIAISCSASSTFIGKDFLALFDRSISPLYLLDIILIRLQVTNEATQSRRDFLDIDEHFQCQIENLGKKGNRKFSNRVSTLIKLK